MPVTGNEGQVFGDGLGEQQMVEWIAMVTGNSSSASRWLRVRARLRNPRTATSLQAPEAELQLADTRLDKDLPQLTMLT
jgi:hypothetical protein